MNPTNAQMEAIYRKKLIFGGMDRDEAIRQAAKMTTPRLIAMMQGR